MGSSSSPKRRYWLGLMAAGFVASPLQAQPASDATRAAARDLATQGVEAFQAGDYPTAALKLDKAFGLLSVPSLGLWLARSLAKTGKLVEAAERYRQVVQLEVTAGDVELQKRAKLDAEREAELSAKIPGIVVQLQGTSEGVSVLLNGALVPAQLLGERQPVNPGTHQVEARRGRATARADVDLAEGETKQIRLSLLGDAVNGASAPPTAAPAPTASGQPPTKGRHDEQRPAGAPLQKTVGLVLGVAGGVGVAVGTVTGAMVLTRRSDFENGSTCADYHCLPSRRDDVESYNRLRTISTVSLIAGGALAASGVVLYLTAPRAPDGLALRLGPLAAALEGHFE